MKRHIWDSRACSSFNRVVSLLLSAALLSSTVCPSVALGSPPDRDGRDPATLNISERLGHIVETFIPNSKLVTRNSKLIIHLQDLHTQYDAQRALADLIQELHRSTDVSLVALEGGAGPGDTKFFSDFPDAQTTNQLADFFLKKGLFTGPVYYAVTHPGQVSLYGVEDPAAYLDHLKTYQTSQAKQQEATQHLQALFTVLHALQDQLDTHELKTLTVTTRAYEAEKLGFSAYFQDLQRRAGRARLSLAAYSNLSRFARLISLERRVDRSAIEPESRHLLETLSQRLSEQDRQNLFTHQRALQAGTLSNAQYYKGLRRFGRKAKIRLTANPYLNFSLYTDSLLLSEKLQQHRLAAELDQLATAIKEHLFTTPDQRQLDQLLTVVGVLQDLYLVRLSPEHFEYYHTHHAAFSAQSFLAFLERRHRLTPALQQAITSLFEDLSAQARFYEIAQKRDHALVTNTLRQMDE